MSWLHAYTYVTATLLPYMTFPIGRASLPTNTAAVYHSTQAHQAAVSVPVGSLFCLPLALAQMCGRLRITCKHLYYCDCYRAAKLCLNIHSAAAILGKMFNCLLTRRANHMVATRCIWACGHVEDVIKMLLLVPGGLLLWILHQLLT